MTRTAHVLSHAAALGALALGAPALGGAALPAQAPRGRPAVLLAAGGAGQYDGGRDLGSPGLSAALGLEWAARPAVGVRLEAQGFRYGAQSLPAVVGARGSAEQVGALSALATWAPGGGRAPYVLGGVALVSATVTGERGRVATGAGVVGLGVPVVGRLGVEAQYLHGGRRLGETRSVLGARLRLRL